MTRHLVTTPNLTGEDDLYQALVTLTDADTGLSLRRQARLILLLANHIGDARVIHEAIAAAARD